MELIDIRVRGLTNVRTIVELDEEGGEAADVMTARNNPRAEADSEREPKGSSQDVSNFILLRPLSSSKL